MMIARLLASARRSGSVLPEPPAIASLRDAYEIQDQVAALTGTTIGWKVGATSAPAQAFLKVDSPLYGRVFAGTVHAAPAEIALPGQGAAEAEPEIIVQAGKDGIEQAFIGLEVNRPSREDALALGAPFIVADNAANAGLILGVPIALEALSSPSRIGVTLLRNGEVVSRGDAAAVLGDPLESLRWLRRVRAGSDRPVLAGDLVATGAMARAAAMVIGDRIEAHFGSYGMVTVTRGRDGKVMAASRE